MDNNKISPNQLLALFFLGALMTLAMAVLAIWPDLEASFYGFNRRASTRLPGLRCPILLDKDETGLVSVKVSNTTERKLSPSVKAEFSSKLLPISTLDSIQIEAGESKTMEWTIGPENVDLDKFIFSKVLVFASYPIPDREATCGTLVIDLPMRGGTMLVLLTVLGVMVMGGALFGLTYSTTLSNRMERAIRPLTFLAILMILTLGVGLAGCWVQGILLLAVTLITMVIAINYVFFRMT